MAGYLCRASDGGLVAHNGILCDLSMTIDLGVAEVYGQAQIFNNVQILDNAKVYGKTHLYGNAAIFKDAIVTSDFVYGVKRLPVLDPRGYEAWACWCDTAKHWYISAGCRMFTPTEAIQHWSKASHRYPHIAYSYVEAVRWVRDQSPGLRHHH